MSEKRYFYSDEAAFWMAKHFSMIFWIKDDHWKDTECNSYKFRLFPEGGYDKLYIHPDSVHLLEPQEGIDLVQYVEYSQQIQADGSPHKICEEYYYGPYQSTLNIGGIDYGTHIKQILKRNGVTFMWPEEEVKL